MAGKVFNALAASFLVTSSAMVSAAPAVDRAPLPVTGQPSEMVGEGNGSAILIALFGAAAVIGIIIIASSDDDNVDEVPVSR